MRTVLFIALTVLTCGSQVSCTATYGTVFPTPLALPNDDPDFHRCPTESGAYTHTANCSLFHMCTFGVHTIYSCIDGFFYNPTSGKCQFWPMEKHADCSRIVQAMATTDTLLLHEPIEDRTHYERRKSSSSTCTQAGVFPDVLDCSLFHYCHPNHQHEILKCSNGLHFDPKIHLCSPPQMVNCQYEPLTQPSLADEESESKSTSQSDAICRNYAAGTFLPVANRFDEFIKCESDGRSSRVQCQSGSIYNALTMGCERKPCAIDAGLCKNQGRCRDEPTDSKGFQCICPMQYQGEFCEQPIQVTSTRNRLTTLDRLAPTAATSTPQTFADAQSQFKAHLDWKTAEKISPPDATQTVRPAFSERSDSSMFHSEEDTDEIIRIAFLTILIFIGCLLLGSISYGLVVCVRQFFSLRIETVGQWKSFADEAKV